MEKLLSVVKIIKEKITALGLPANLLMSKIGKYLGFIKIKDNYMRDLAVFLCFFLSLIDGTFLVINHHYAWAWIPFLFAFLIIIKK